MSVASNAVAFAAAHSRRYNVRNWILCSCICLALPCFASAQQTTAPEKFFAGPSANKPVPRSPLEVALEAKVRAAWAALQNKDKNAYAQFLTDDFHAVEIDGEGERTKSRVLAEVENIQFNEHILQFFLVQPLGPDYASVTYESTMKFPRKSILRQRRVFVGELWARQGIEWKIMRYQETGVR
jgi:ketosteroid isomerase-like protein